VCDAVEKYGAYDPGAPIPLVLDAPNYQTFDDEAEDEDEDDGLGEDDDEDDGGVDDDMEAWREGDVNNVD
jgi:hypothetical protein